MSSFAKKYSINSSRLSKPFLWQNYHPHGVLKLISVVTIVVITI